MPAWSCKDCVPEAGHCYASAGWCAVGGHAVKTRVEWHPDAIPVASRVTMETPAPIPAAAIPTPTQPPQQLALF